MLEPSKKKNIGYMAYNQTYEKPKIKKSKTNLIPKRFSRPIETPR